MKTHKQARKDFKQLIKGMQLLYDKGAGLTSFSMQNDMRDACYGEKKLE